MQKRKQLYILDNIFAFQLIVMDLRLVIGDWHW